MNGKEGDAPFTDIVVHGGPVFHPKVDQLIRDLSESGGFDDPFAPYFIDSAALVWSRFEAVYASGGNLSNRDMRLYRQNWLRNFAFILWLRLVELRGDEQGGEGIRLPIDRDPTLP